MASIEVKRQAKTEGRYLVRLQILGKYVKDAPSFVEVDGAITGDAHRALAWLIEWWRKTNRLAE